VTDKDVREVEARRIAVRTAARISSRSARAETEKMAEAFGRLSAWYASAAGIGWVSLCEWFRVLMCTKLRSESLRVYKRDTVAGGNRRLGEPGLCGWPEAPATSDYQEWGWPEDPQKRFNPVPAKVDVQNIFAALRADSLNQIA
jgi:hypothetical protein